MVDLPVWALDRPLTYEVPARLQDAVRVGAVVRVPLRGRRVRGWVVGVRREEEPPGDVAAIARASATVPVFDSLLLEVLTGLARRHVHPRSSFLRLVVPPRVGGGRRRGAMPEGREVAPAGFRPEIWRMAPGEDAALAYAPVIEEALEAGLGAIVAVPEVREGSRLLDALESRFPADAAVVHTGRGPAERSRALWAVAAAERRLVLGGRAAVLAPAVPLGAVVVHGEHDRSLKEQRSPYYHAVPAAYARARAAGARLILSSPSPSLVSWHRAEGEGWVQRRPQRELERRSWPAVELVEPARTPLPSRAVAAVLAASRAGQTTALLLPRTGATPSGPGPEELIRYLRRVVPGARISRADRPGLGSEPGALAEALAADVVVASEAALADVEWPPLGAAIALGVDALLARPLASGHEETFALLWAFGSLVARRPGGDPQAPRGRLLLETRRPEHHVVQALTRGDYHYFARHELEARHEGEWPPFRTLVKLSLPSGLTDETRARLSGLRGVRVLGPVEGRAGEEMLLKVEDLEVVLDPLREIVATAREPIFVDVDPRDW
ncbi:MAG: hypothetical protein ACRDJ4_15455 [Actinomycetota bacterium]